MASDIKPENILCVPDASGQLRLKIVDFGAAKPLEHDLCASVSGTTVWNASPERGYGEAESTSADVWALGSVLYFMLTGNSPFHNLYEGSADDGVVIDRCVGECWARACVSSFFFFFFGSVLEEDLEWPASPAVSPTGRLTVEWLLSKVQTRRPGLGSRSHARIGGGRSPHLGRIAGRRVADAASIGCIVSKLVRIRAF